MLRNFVGDWPWVGEALLAAALLADRRCLYTAAPAFAPPGTETLRPWLPPAPL